MNTLTTAMDRAMHVVALRVQDRRDTLTFKPCVEPEEAIAEALGLPKSAATRSITPHADSAALAVLIRDAKHELSFTDQPFP